MSEIKRAAVIGGGVIGAGWIARLTENGVDVSVFDPAEDARSKIEVVLENAAIAAKNLFGPTGIAPGQITYCSSIEQAVGNVDLVVEAVPERLELKQTVYGLIETATANETIIASSTSGILPTDLQQKMQHPARLLVAHPFNPVYLLPLVELVGGEQTSDQTTERATRIYKSLGMHPLHVRKEIEAFIADRFLEAVWREALWLIKDGIATTEEIDDAIRYGFGLRWAQMGLFETFRIAGGDAGMRHFIAQFGPCLKWPWTKLMDVPELTGELTETIVSQSDAQSGHYSIHELERIRDANLVGILKSLKKNNWGAGKTLAIHQQNLRKKSQKYPWEER